MKRKFCAVFTALVILSLCTLQSFAVEANPNILKGSVINEKTYFDSELGATVTEKIYFTPDTSIPLTRAVSGAGTYTNEISMIWGTTKSRYYVSAYFKWGNGKISVSNPKKGMVNHSKDIKIVTDTVTTNVDWHWFHDCGYVRRTIKFKNVVGSYSTREITMRVNSTNGSACW